LTRSLEGQGARFLIAGAVNSAATYLLYLLLLRLLPYGWAYSLSYVLGVGLSFLLNSLYVFRVPLRWRNLVRFPLVYAAQYLLGLGVLALAVERLGLDERLGPVAVLAVTVPASFALTRWVLKERKPGEERYEDGGESGGEE
jgi:putative flippase GtrA